MLEGVGSIVDAGGNGIENDPDASNRADGFTTSLQQPNPSRLSLPKAKQQRVEPPVAEPKKDLKDEINGFKHSFYNENAATVAQNS